jgi:RNA polymerase sigma-54 factor
MFYKYGMAMQLSQSMGVRMEQRQLLTPRMIQSMEILQLPLMALGGTHRTGAAETTRSWRSARADQEAAGTARRHRRRHRRQGRREDFSEAEKPMVVKENCDQAEDFERLAKISEYFENEDFAASTRSNFPCQQLRGRARIASSTR